MSVCVLNVEWSGTVWVHYPWLLWEGRPYVSIWGISGLHLLSWWNSSVYFPPSVSWFRQWIIWLLCSFLRTGIGARVMWNWAFHMSLVGVVCGKKVLFFLYGKLRTVALKLWCNGLLLSHHCIVITKGEVAFFLFLSEVGASVLFSLPQPLINSWKICLVFGSVPLPPKT